MALTTNINLETHGNGTVGLNGIIDGNWARLDLIFSPALGSGDVAFNNFWQCVVRSATDPTVDGAQIEWDVDAGKPVWRAGVATITYAATHAFNCDGALMQSMALTGNFTFDSLANQATGKQIDIRITAGGSLRTLSFPAGWTFIGSAAPADIAANKTAILKIRCFGGADADVVAEWTVEP